MPMNTEYQITVTRHEAIMLLRLIGHHTRAGGTLEEFYDRVKDVTNIPRPYQLPKLEEAERNEYRPHACLIAED